LTPGYDGVLRNPVTFVHTPPCRTCTVRVVNHPPSLKFMPSWKTTRWNV
jgi:hypothetical protein